MGRSSSLEYDFIMCNMTRMDEYRNAYIILVGLTERNKFLGRQRRSWEDGLMQGSSTRGPHAALRRVLCGPGRVFHKIQCVMIIEA